MPQMSLAKTRFRAGVWEGRLTGAGRGEGAPEVTARVQDRPLPVTLTPAEEGDWSLALPLPGEVLGDGLVTVVIETPEGILAQIPILAGEALAGDLAAEVARLRAELDVLKAVVQRLGRAREGAEG